jgi:hypothetical protein
MPSFDFATLKRAMETADVATLIDLYAHDAEMTVVDRNTSPSKPMRVTGKANIGTYWLGVCGRDMTHRIGHEVVAPGRAAFVEECAYPDGCRVVAAMTLDLSGDHIARHLIVQAWDEESAQS